MEFMELMELMEPLAEAVATGRWLGILCSRAEANGNSLSEWPRRPRMCALLFEVIVLLLVPPHRGVVICLIGVAKPPGPPERRGVGHASLMLNVR